MNFNLKNPVVIIGLIFIALFIFNPGLFSTITYNQAGLDPGIPWDFTQALINPIYSSTQSCFCPSAQSCYKDLDYNSVSGNGFGASLDVPSYSWNGPQRVSCPGLGPNPAPGVSSSNLDRVNIGGEWFTTMTAGDGGPANDFRGKRLRIKVNSEQFDGSVWVDALPPSTMTISGCSMNLADTGAPGATPELIETRPRVLNPEIIDVFKNDVFQCGITLSPGEKLSVNFYTPFNWGNFNYPASNQVWFNILTLDQDGCVLDENEMLVMSTETASFNHFDLAYSEFFSKYCLEVSPTIASLTAEGNVAFANDLRAEVPFSLMKGEDVCVNDNCANGILSITLPRVITIPQGLTPCPSGQAWDLDDSVCVSVTGVPVIVPSGNGTLPPVISGGGGGGGRPVSVPVVPIPSIPVPVECDSVADCNAGEECKLQKVCPNSPDACQDMNVCVSVSSQVVSGESWFDKTVSFVRANLIWIAVGVIVLLAYFGFTNSGRNNWGKIKRVFRRKK